MMLFGLSTRSTSHQSLVIAVRSAQTAKAWSSSNEFLGRRAINRVLQAAIELQEFCVQQKYKFCFIGGVAVQRWGEPRLTVDADITLLTGFGNEEPFIQALIGRFPGRRPDAAAFALQSRVLLLRASNGVFLDIALAGLPFEERTLQRDSSWRISKEASLITCCAEDLVVYKAFANRDLDWLDVKGILQRQGATLNIELIFEELRPLLQLKEEPEIEERLQKMIEEEQRSE
jgi:hypothetical protein